MQSGISLSIGACNAGNMPSGARALGCRITADRRRVTVLVPVAKGAALLADIRARGAIAAVFSQPSTHRTLQLKGVDAMIEPITDDDHRIAAQYRAAFVHELDLLGYDPRMISAMLDPGQDGFVAVSFTPDAAFSQTPGPNAGAPLGARP